MPMNTRPKTGGHIPLHLVTEYADYWRQWFGREARAIEQAEREGWTANR
jgi:hypothetical protein